MHSIHTLQTTDKHNFVLNGRQSAVTITTLVHISITINPIYNSVQTVH